MRSVVLTFFQRWNVESTPTPKLTEPSPIGKTHPYPGTVAPAASRRSSWLSMKPSSDFGLAK